MTSRAAYLDYGSTEISDDLNPEQPSPSAKLPASNERKKMLADSLATALEYGKRLAIEEGLYPHEGRWQHADVPDADIILGANDWLVDQTGFTYDEFVDGMESTDLSDAVEWAWSLQGEPTVQWDASHMLRQGNPWQHVWDVGSNFIGAAGSLLVGDLSGAREAWQEKDGHMYGYAPNPYGGQVGNALGIHNWGDAAWALLDVADTASFGMQGMIVAPVRSAAAHAQRRLGNDAVARIIGGKRMREEFAEQAARAADTELRTVWDNISTGEREVIEADYRATHEIGLFDPDPDPADIMRWYEQQGPPGTPTGPGTPTEDADRLASVIRNDDGLDLFEYWKAVADESGYTDSIIGSEAWKDDLWNDDLVNSAENLYAYLREKTGPIQQQFQPPEMHQIFQTIRDFASKRLDDLERRLGPPGTPEPHPLDRRPGPQQREPYPDTFTPDEVDQIVRNEGGLTDKEIEGLMDDPPGPPYGPMSGGSGVSDINVRGEADPLSNFYQDTEADLYFRGHYFKSGEGAYQAFKSGRYEHGFEKLSGPRAKEFGRQVDTDIDITEDLMREILEARYEQSRAFRAMLLESGDARLTHNVPGRPDHWNTQGRDTYARLLMELRAKYQAQPSIIHALDNNPGYFTSPDDGRMLYEQFKRDRSGSARGRFGAQPIEEVDLVHPIAYYGGPEQQRKWQISGDPAPPIPASPLPAPVFEESVYHGAFGADVDHLRSYIDPETGELVLYAASNFEGRISSVSFSPSIDSAWDYGTRIKGAGPDARDAGLIFEIDRSFLDERLVYEAEEELAVNFSLPHDSTNAVRIPSSKFRVLETLTEENAAGWATARRELRESYASMSDEELAARYGEYLEAGEVHEHSGIDSAGPQDEELFDELWRRFAAIDAAPPAAAPVSHSVTKIISGGQTGADVGGLLAGRDLGLETGGWIPEGFLTEGATRGSRISRPDLGEEFGLREAPHGPSRMGDEYRGETWMYDYFNSHPWGPRTVANAAESDGTLWIGTTTSAGYGLTKKGVKAANKHMFFVNLANIDNPDTRRRFMEWLAQHDIRTLNVAGNRQLSNKGIDLEAETRRFLNETLGGIDDDLSRQWDDFSEERLVEEPSDDLGEEMDWVEKEALHREEVEALARVRPPDGPALSPPEAIEAIERAQLDFGGYKNPDKTPELASEYYFKLVQAAHYHSKAGPLLREPGWPIEGLTEAESVRQLLEDYAVVIRSPQREAPLPPLQKSRARREMLELTRAIDEAVQSRMDELHKFVGDTAELLPAPDPVPMLKDATVQHHSAAITDIDVNDLNAHIEEMIPTNPPPEGTVGGYPTGAWWPSHLGYNRQRIPVSGPTKHPDTHIQGDPGTTYYYTKGMFTEASGDVQPWSPMIRDIKERVEEITGYDFDLVLIQRYPTGQTDLGWHADLAQQRDPVTGQTLESNVNPLTGSTEPEKVVVSVNFGATREFAFRRIGFTGTQQQPAVAKSVYREEVAAANRREAARGQGSIELGNGDILMMGEGTNANYQHSIVRDPDLVGEGGLRINLTFRQIDEDLIAVPRREVGPYAEVAHRKTKLPMNFDYGKRGALPRAENVTSDNTFDAILAGERTATSRTRQGGQLDGVEVGDVIHLIRGDRSIRVRVTEKRLAGEISPQEWAALEGYDATAATRDWATGKMYSQYVQIEFELLDLPRGPR